VSGLLLFRAPCTRRKGVAPLLEGPGARLGPEAAPERLSGWRCRTEEPLHRPQPRYGSADLRSLPSPLGARFACREGEALLGGSFSFVPAVAEQGDCS